MCYTCSEKNVKGKPLVRVGHKAKGLGTGKPDVGSQLPSSEPCDLFYESFEIRE